MAMRVLVAIKMSPKSMAFSFFLGVMLCTLCNVRAKWMPGSHTHYGSEQTSMLVRRL